MNTDFPLRFQRLREYAENKEIRAHLEESAF